MSNSNATGKLFLEDAEGKLTEVINAGQFEFTEAKDPDSSDKLRYPLNVRKDFTFTITDINREAFDLMTGHIHQIEKERYLFAKKTANALGMGLLIDTYPYRTVYIAMLIIPLGTEIIVEHKFDPVLDKR